MEMEIINVIEVIDGAVSGITSYPITSESIRSEVIANAEANFKAKALENGASEDNLDSHIDDGYYEKTDYFLSITWSEVIE